MHLNNANNGTDIRNWITRLPLDHDYGESDKNQSIYRFIIYNDDVQVQFSYKLNGVAHYLRTAYVHVRDRERKKPPREVLNYILGMFPDVLPNSHYLYQNLDEDMWSWHDFRADIIKLLSDGPTRYKGFKVICP